MNMHAPSEATCHMKMFGSLTSKSIREVLLSEDMSDHGRCDACVRVGDHVMLWMFSAKARLLISSVPA